MNQHIEIPCLTLTVKQAAAALGVGRQTVLKLIQEQRLRCVRLGRKIIIPRDAVYDFLNQSSN